LALPTSGRPSLSFYQEEYMEELHNTEEFMNYFRKIKQGFICVEAKPNKKTWSVSHTEFYFITDVIEPDKIVYKEISKHGNTMFVLQFANIIDDIIPLNDFGENIITALDRREFKKMWVLSRLEAMNEKA